MTTNAREEAAARAMAAAFDYPWEPMPDKGREEMRKNARAVLAAADGVAGVPAGSIQTDRAALQMLVAGALYDFAGFLTTRGEIMTIGAAANAGPMADLLKEFAELRCLSLDDPAIVGWDIALLEATTTSPTQQQPAQHANIKRPYTLEELRAKIATHEYSAELLLQHAMLLLLEPQPVVAPNLACKSVQARLAAQWGYVRAESAQGALCDCGKMPAADCVPWEPSCDLGKSQEHAQRVPAQGVSDERAAFEADYRRRYELGGHVRSVCESEWRGWQARAALAEFGAGVPEVTK